MYHVILLIHFDLLSRRLKNILEQHPPLVRIRIYIYIYIYIIVYHVILLIHFDLLSRRLKNILEQHPPLVRIRMCTVPSVVVGVTSSSFKGRTTFQEAPTPLKFVSIMQKEHTLLVTGTTSSRYENGELLLFLHKRA